MHEMKAKSETLSWTLPGALLGMALGAIFAIGHLAVLMGPGGDIEGTYGPNGDGFALLVVQFGIPLVLVLFGGFAGALVGAGVPRYNPHPQQGKKRKAYHYHLSRERGAHGRSV